MRGIEERFMTRKEAARVSGFTEATLAKWAVLNKGPKFAKFGSGRSARVRYPLSSLLEFMHRGQTDKPSRMRPETQAHRTAER